MFIETDVSHSTFLKFIPYFERRIENIADIYSDNESTLEQYLY